MPDPGDAGAQDGGNAVPWRTTTSHGRGSHRAADEDAVGREAARDRLVVALGHVMAGGTCATRRLSERVAVNDAANSPRRS